MAPPQFGTVVTTQADIQKPFKAAQEKLTPQQKCEQDGGFWDVQTQTCLRVPPKQDATPTPTPKKTGQLETFTDPKTGAATGITTKTGNTYLGAISPEELAAIGQQQARIDFRPENMPPVGTAATQQREQQRNQQLLQMAQQGLLTPEQLQQIGGADVDWSQALGAGALGAAPGLIGGATTGVLAGVGAAAITGASVGAAAGLGSPLSIALAAAGALTGFLVAIRSNIKGQQTGEFAADQSALSKGEKALRSLVTDTDQNPQNTGENIAMFYQMLNNIDAAHAKTWKDSQENLNRFMGNDGIPQLAKFEIFNKVQRQYYINQMNAAIGAPNPNRILVTFDDIESGAEL